MSRHDGCGNTLVAGRGAFIVKSVYHVQLRDVQSVATSSSSTSNDAFARTWKGLWSTTFMSKIRTFL